MSVINEQSDHAAPATLPLAGVTVVEIGQNLAGPFCGEILGTLGADVVKIEKPSGDDCRGWGPPFVGEASVVFHAFNKNKRSITVDLADAPSRQWLIDFIGARDIVIHNMRPGAMKKLGLDDVTLRRRFPRLIYGSISGFGAVGPLKDRPGYDAIVQAVAGVFSVNGDPNGPTSRVGLSVLDMGTGLWIALGCIAALRQRDATGQGCLITGSLYETALSWMASYIGVASSTGTQPPRDRAGAPKIATYQCFSTKDGEILIAAANDRLFRKLVPVLGRPEWASDARFHSNADRLLHRDFLSREIAAILVTRTSREWEDELGAVGFPVAAINDMRQMLEHPQTAAVDMLEAVPDSTLKLPRMPISFDNRRPLVRTLAPGMGEHNRDLVPPHLLAVSAGGARDA